MTWPAEIKPGTVLVLVNAAVSMGREWLEGKPLSSHISENPDEEDLKVRRLKSLLATVSDTGQRRST